MGLAHMKTAAPIPTHELLSSISCVEPYTYDEHLANAASFLNV